MQVRIPSKLKVPVIETEAQDLSLQPGQLVLAVGGSKSGKSKLLEIWAQEMANLWQVPLLYLATLEVGDDPENQARVDRHRAQRAGKGFETLEASCQIRQVLKAESLKWQAKPVLLLECLGTLTANEIFSPCNQARQAFWGLPAHYDQAPEPGLAGKIAQDLLADLAWLKKQTNLTLIASNDVFSNCPAPDPWSRLWLDTLGLVHCGLAQDPSCLLVEVAAGIPLVWSGFPLASQIRSVL
ncbi:MAG: bifunctional adenosylcobinamide kinase/adenosylcobinamide-phosphate guanylyltransferase [Eubacteriales bacterium]|nr:bifunctional adenosylcobinamide kinase/adenosylcobinamide-phosphate guanylyltransferase [Clostridiales bacterium]MDY5835897.1 bifunctional adenosylcobinamide kinase/adenosylcobinamide-phosphate guanylyltransferase [Eubacteriales bacterium]